MKLQIKTMKATELMVGDYLMHSGFPYRVIQVDGIVRDGWMIENGEEDCGEPIPITPEILEKNGFEEYDGAYIYYTAHYDDYVNWCGTILKIGCDNGNMELADVQYVHELQHCLRMCNINKTINL